jgi:hypothetical protein
MRMEAGRAEVLRIRHRRPPEQLGLHPVRALGRRLTALSGKQAASWRRPVVRTSSFEVRGSYPVITFPMSCSDVRQPTDQ